MEEPWRNLNGKVVLVTGASSGIGKEICIDLAAAGCRIIAAARRNERLKLLCDDINRRYSETSELRAVALELDVSANSSVIEAAAQKAWNMFGRIDVLVNNAGIRGNIHSSLDWPEDEWHAIFATNLTGLWLLSKYVCKQMCNAKIKGSVINISSISALHRAKATRTLAYAASKEGVHAVTTVMAIELGVYNIRVNCICPGLFQSEITEGLMKKPWLNTVFKKIVPLKTYGTTNPAMTSVVRYLIDDSSEYVTGNVFIVDSGSTLTGIPIFSSL